MMEACAEFDIRELWISTAGAKPYKGKFGTDRFRTDVSWEEQLEATRRFLLKLKPIAQDLGIHLNLETHEEITTFEILRSLKPSATMSSASSSIRRTFLSGASTRSWPPSGSPRLCARRI